MKPNGGSPAISAGEVKRAADALCKRFEQAWQSGSKPVFASWVPPGGPLRPAALLDLALLDLDYRFRAGESARAEDYFSSYPELRDDPEASSRLRAAEVQLQRQKRSPQDNQAEQNLGTIGDGTRAGAAMPSDTLTWVAPGDEGIDPEKLLAPPANEGELGRLGHYRVLRVLGQGGMGMVLLAEDSQLLRMVALKVMLPQYARDTQSRERFLREARTAAQVKHDNIVTIFQVGEDRGVPFIALEYLQGTPLNTYLDEGRDLTIRQVIRIGREIAEGLQAAHARGLIHRDIKPANIWLEAPKGRVKILDFGLARLERDDSHITQSGAVVGTPAFMSPEQARGEVNPRSDLFSLGVVLYRLCTGKQPFAGSSTFAILTSLAADTPAPVRELNPNVPLELERLITRLMAKNPDERPASAQEVVRKLEAIGNLARNAAHPPYEAISFDTAIDNKSSANERPPAGAAAGVPTPQPGAHGNGPGSRRSRWLALALAFVPFLLAAGGWYLIQIRNKDGTTTEIKVPDDSTISVTENGKEVVVVPGKKDSPNKATAPNPEAGRQASVTPLNPFALVRSPAALKGVRSWTVDTRGPRGEVYAVAYDPHGAFLATAGADGLVRIYDAENWKLLRILAGHTDIVFGLAWSPDGKQLASCAGDNDRTVRIWELGTGRLVHVLKGHDRGVDTVAWSPDGKTVASGGTGLTVIHLWDPITGKPKGVLNGHEGSVTSLAWSPDSKWLASGSGDNTVRLWDPASGKPPVVFKEHLARVLCVAWSPDGQELASGSAGVGPDRAIRFCGIDGKRTREPLQWLGRCPMQSIAWSPDGTRIVACGSNLAVFQSSVAAWDLKTGRLDAGLRLRTGWPRSLAWAPNGARLAIGCVEGCVRLLDLGPGKRHNGAIGLRPYLAAAWSPDGTRIALASGSRNLYLMDANGSHLKPLTKWGGPLASQAPSFSPDGKKIVFTSDSDSRIRVIPVDGGDPQPIGAAVGRDLAWAPDGNRILFVSQPKGQKGFLGRIIDLGDASVAEINAIHAANAYPAWSPDGKSIAWGGDNSEIFVADSDGKNARAITKQGGSNYHPTWSPDGTRIAFSHGQGNALQILVMKADGGQVKQLGQRLTLFSDLVLVHSLSWSGDGATLAVAGEDGTLRVCDVDSGRPGSQLLLLDNDRYLIVSPDGHYRGSPDIEKELVYVVQTAAGDTETLTSQEFTQKYNWKNNPERVRLLESHAKVEATPPANKGIVPPPEPGADPDRRAAGVLHPYIDLTVRLKNGSERLISKKDPLPDQPFALIRVAVAPTDGPFPADFHTKVLLPTVLDLPFLEAFRLGNQRPWPLGEKELDQLARAPFASRLSDLNAAVELTPATIDVLRRFPKLSSLACLCDRADDEILTRLPELPGLKILYLRGQPQSQAVTQRGYDALAHLPLKVLYFDGPSLTAEALRKFASMPELISFGFNGKVGDELLPEVAKFPRLQILLLGGNPGVTDAGLAHLAGMKTLRTLVLSRTKVTEAGAKKLSEALPKCVIMLGVGKTIGPRDKSGTPPSAEREQP